MRSSLLLFACSLVLAIVATSCGNSSDSSGNDGNPTDPDAGSIGPGSFGSAEVTVNTTTKFTSSNTFLCYDTSTHMLSLMVDNTWPTRIYVKLKIPSLAVGTYHFPADSASITVGGTNQTMSRKIPYRDTVTATIWKLDKVKQTIAVGFSIHLRDRVADLLRVDTVIFADAGYAVVPYGPKLTFAVTIDGTSFSNGQPQFPSASFNTISSYPGVIFSRVGDGTTTPGNTEFSMELAPSYFGVQTTQLNLANSNMRYRYWEWDSQHANVNEIDFFMTATPTISLNITKFDTSHRIIEGTFSGTLTDMNGKVAQLSGGSFTNAFLNPY